jgi:predicted TIM-barrel fold metal-dependent hydrolase
MRDLKFIGAMIDGHTNGQYLDHPPLYPFWKRAEVLGAPIYNESTEEAGHFIDSVPIAEDPQANICVNEARKYLGL